MGGGITLDIGGFIAGLLHLPVSYVPTTLLAAVDAAIGGKTGVNFMPYGKNQIGLFYEAHSFQFVPEYLDTLPQEEKLCGVVEALKHSYLFGEFETDKIILDKIILNTASHEELAQIVNKNIQYKTQIVNLDPQEKNGIRASLNFGHTFAHVLEALVELEYIEKIPHGIAVAHGILFLMDLELINKNNIYAYTKELITNYPILLKKRPTEELIRKLLSQDKKNNHDKICTLSLPEYGIFSFNINAKKVTKEFPIEELSDKILQQLLSTTSM